MSDYRFDPTDGSIKDQDGDMIVSPPDCGGCSGFYKDSHVPGEPSSGVDVPFMLLVEYVEHHFSKEAEKEARWREGEAMFGHLSRQ